jgi:8-oxo-dGTP pyrophosphatase MutT (NUDIX family)
LQTVLDDIKRRIFWIFARTCFTLYRWFPVFGTLRASLAIIRREDSILVILRNDGRGLSLPGGLASWQETELETLHREVREETGLNVSGEALQLRYYSAADVPCNTSVFEVQATGELRNSWEGSPRWMTVDELEPRLLPSQRPLFGLLRKSPVTNNTQTIQGERNNTEHT